MKEIKRTKRGVANSDVPAQRHFSIYWFLLIILFLIVLAALALPGHAQVAAQADPNLAVPHMIRFHGTLVGNSGEPSAGTVGITFGLYKDQEGGTPLWLETQNVIVDSAGHYSVQLGSTRPEGLPTDLFATGEARWLGTQVEGQREQARVLLLSVPYALKAADAETLGGLPPSAFVLAAPPASLQSGADPVSISSSPSTLPPATNVTGTGTADFIPLWTSASNIANSVLFQSGSGTTAKVGLNTATPGATLDVRGTSSLGGLLTLPATGAATSTVGKNSQAEDFVASAFNSGTVAAVKQTFQWQAEPAGNNTTTPSGTLNLLFGSGTTAPAETGFKVSSKGLFTFATGQTFPGTGTITGVTAGTDLTGGGTSGKVTLNLDTTKVPLLSAINTFTANQRVGGSVTALSFSGNGAAVTNVNASKLGGLAPAAFAQLAANNTFSGTQTINNSVAVTSNISLGAALNVTDTNGGNGIQAFSNAVSGYALYGGNTNGGTGVGGNSTSGNGVRAQNNSTTQAAMYAENDGGGPAGFFSGNVQLTGQITSYNGTPTVANGVPSIVLHLETFSGGSGISNTNLYTPANDAVFRITGFQECTATSGGGTLFSMNFFWTLPTGGTGGYQIGTGPDCSILDGTAGSFVAHVKGGTTIQFNYASMNAPFQTTILIEQLL